MNRSELREELVALLLQDELRYTTAQVAERGGVGPEQAQRLWRALGFPDPGETVAFGDADVRAIRSVQAGIEQGVLEDDTTVRLTRALGQTMAKLADWEVSTLIDQLERDVGAGRAGSRLERATWLAQHAAPVFEELMLHVWRRHLAAAAARLEALGAADEELLSMQMTVGFADLSRFTSLSNSLDDNDLAALVERFEERCADLITAQGGRVIKTLGDAILYVSPDPCGATRTALDLVAQVGSRDDLPAIRVGLATGSVISRLGDVFGPPVNLAARLSHVARSNRVLVDDDTAATLGQEFEQRALPPRPLRGFGNVSPITVSQRRGFRTR
ncbi:adenylate/guanylate cyclase catalytic domain protein [Aeromicrobium marinum DSM 15272]|uniref:Adenylate/guanylate cyclase catalytic domain protein n=1 Tax=Aeromicrobium marinum DSM 15272 TaxID=585531 RepID=E2SBM5_9ACTN|nr:adenylate/guanylate cyclase domain-containing protein [Aeromicrobium marinum]EFQ83771.1 adenylate/guanylate cyclase catalytic domain protein [Aeromicrobium marinum DSM 15272]